MSTQNSIARVDNSSRFVRKEKRVKKIFLGVGFVIKNTWGDRKR